MSFYCERCRKLAPAGTKATMVSVAIRQKGPGNPGGDWGTEIVKEERQCEACALEWTRLTIVLEPEPDIHTYFEDLL